MAPFLSGQVGCRVQVLDELGCLARRQAVGDAGLRELVVGVTESAILAYSAVRGFGPTPSGISP